MKLPVTEILLLLTGPNPGDGEEEGVVEVVVGEVVATVGIGDTAAVTMAMTTTMITPLPGDCHHQDMTMTEGQ